MRFLTVETEGLELLKESARRHDVEYEILQSQASLPSVLQQMDPNELVVFTSSNCSIVAEDKERIEQCARALLEEAGDECIAVVACRAASKYDALPWDPAVLKVATPYLDGNCFAGFAGNLAKLCSRLSKVQGSTWDLTEYFVARYFENPKAFAMDRRGLLFACVDGTNAWAFNERAVLRRNNLQPCILFFDMKAKPSLLPFVPYELREYAVKFIGNMQQKEQQRNGMRLQTWIPPKGNALLLLLLLLTLVLGVV